MTTATRDRKIAAGALGLGIAGFLVPLFLLFLVTRDQLISSTLLAHVVPIVGGVPFRTAIALLLAWIAIGQRGLGPNFSAFGRWGWIVLGSFGVLLLVEGIVTIASNSAPPKQHIIILINSSIVLFALGVAYLFAARRLQPREVLEFLLRPYCYLTVAIAVLGLAAWMLVFFNLVDPHEWRMPTGVLKKDASAPRGEYYTAPLYLSLVLYNTAGAVVFGIDFKRASGLFQEPHQAAFFVTPALFLMPLVFKSGKNRWKLYISCLLLSAFLFVTYSVANLVLLTVIGSILLGKVTFTHPSAAVRPLALFSLSVLMVFVWLAVSTPGTIRSKVVFQVPGYIESTLWTLQEAPFVALSDLVGEQSEGGSATVMSTLVVMLHLGTLAVVGLWMMLARNAPWYIGAAITYVALHPLKSFWYFGTSGIYLYLLFVIALALACYWRDPLSAQRGITPAGRGQMDRLGSSKPVA